jgi:putative transposase
VIEALRSRFTIKELCDYLKVSESGYFKFKKNLEVDKDKDIKKMILEMYEASDKQWGYRTIHMELKEDKKMIINHKRVYRLCKVLGIQSVIRKKRKSPNINLHKQTEPEVIAENLLNRDFTASSPNQKWVTDITTFKVGNKLLYLSAVMDLFNKEILAYNVSAKAGTAFVIQTVYQAIQKEKDVHNVLLHSDRGGQYTSKLYQNTLEAYDIKASMSRPGNPLDNACIESFFSHLKSEAFHPYSVQNIEELKARIHDYMFRYNHIRRQRRLNRQSPVNFRKQFFAA